MQRNATDLYWLALPVPIVVFTVYKIAVERSCAAFECAILQTITGTNLYFIEHDLLLVLYR